MSTEHHTKMNSAHSNQRVTVCRWIQCFQYHYCEFAKTQSNIHGGEARETSYTPIDRCPWKGAPSWRRKKLNPPCTLTQLQLIAAIRPRQHGNGARPDSRGAAPSQTRNPDLVANATTSSRPRDAATTTRERESGIGAYPFNWERQPGRARGRWRRRLGGPRGKSRGPPSGRREDERGTIVYFGAIVLAWS
jgi:hypothetical protein